jgi:hypothetical protein
MDGNDVRQIIDEAVHGTGRTVGRTHSAQAQVFGVSETEANLGVMVVELLKQTKITSREAADMLLERSHEQVPYDTGELYDSGTSKDMTVREEEPEFWVYYDTEYALRVHEGVDMNFGQGAGPTPSGLMRPHPEHPKKAHFLSDPAEAMRDELFKKAQKDLEQVIQKVAVDLKPRLVKKPR